MSKGNPRLPLDEMQQCFVDLERLLETALNEAECFGATDMLQRITAAKAAVDHGTDLLAKLSEQLGVPEGDGPR